MRKAWPEISQNYYEYWIRVQHLWSEISAAKEVWDTITTQNLLYRIFASTLRSRKWKIFRIFQQYSCDSFELCRFLLSPVGPIEIENWIFGAMNLLSFTFGNNLHEVYIENSKILQIIVTTPMTKAEEEPTFWKLMHLKTFLKDTMVYYNRPNPLAIMSIEGNFMHKINCCSFFRKFKKI